MHHIKKRGRAMLKTKKLIIILIAFAIAITSCIFVGNKVSDPEFYSKNIESLEEVKTDAFELTALATATAAAVAVVPGDATTPLANKLMDIAGYMVIVCTAIIAEKYLVVLSGTLAFRILIPLACLLVILGCILRNVEGRERMNRIAAKVAIVGVLLWALIPASIGISNFVDKSYQGIINVSQSSKSVEQTSETEATETKSDTVDKNDKFAFLKKLTNKAKVAATSAKDGLSDKVDDAINKTKIALNEFIEKVALLIVRTCVIPIGALIVGLWIIKTMFSIPIGPVRLPKASKMIKKGETHEE